MNPAFGLCEFEQKSTRIKWDILYAGPDLLDEIHGRAKV
jgi:hypothetical protein